MKNSRTITSYAIGFVLCALLSSAAVLLISIHDWSGHHMFTHQFLRYTAATFAMLQFVIQLIFFMHLADEKGPRWMLATFVSTVSIVFIVVAGSIWIMAHLNYNMMASPSEMNQYIQSQDGF